jgi:hypothetical protein
MQFYLYFLFFILIHSIKPTTYIQPKLPYSGKLSFIPAKKSLPEKDPQPKSEYPPRLNITIRKNRKTLSIGKKSEEKKHISDEKIIIGRLTLIKKRKHAKQLNIKIKKDNKSGQPDLSINKSNIEKNLPITNYEKSITTYQDAIIAFFGGLIKELPNQSVKEVIVVGAGTLNGGEVDLFKILASNKKFHRSKEIMIGLSEKKCPNPKCPCIEEKINYCKEYFMSEEYFKDLNIKLNIIEKPLDEKNNPIEDNLMQSIIMAFNVFHVKGFDLKSFLKNTNTGDPSQIIFGSVRLKKKVNLDNLEFSDKEEEANLRFLIDKFMSEGLSKSSIEKEIEGLYYSISPEIFFPAINDYEIISTLIKLNGGKVNEIRPLNSTNPINLEEGEKFDDAYLLFSLKPRLV